MAQAQSGGSGPGLRGELDEYFSIDTGDDPSLDLILSQARPTHRGDVKQQIEERGGTESTESISQWRLPSEKGYLYDKVFDGSDLGLKAADVYGAGAPSTRPRNLQGELDRASKERAVKTANTNARAKEPNGATAVAAPVAGAGTGGPEGRRAVSSVGRGRVSTSPRQISRRLSSYQGYLDSQRKSRRGARPGTEVDNLEIDPNAPLPPRRMSAVSPRARTARAGSPQGLHTIAKRGGQGAGAGGAVAEDLENQIQTVLRNIEALSKENDSLRAQLEEQNVEGEYQRLRDVIRSQAMALKAAFDDNKALHTISKYQEQKIEVNPRSAQPSAGIELDETRLNQPEVQARILLERSKKLAAHLQECRERVRVETAERDMIKHQVSDLKQENKNLKRLCDHFKLCLLNQEKQHKASARKPQYPPEELRRPRPTPREPAPSPIKPEPGSNFHMDGPNYEPGSRSSLGSEGASADEVEVNIRTVKNSDNMLTRLNDQINEQARPDWVKAAENPDLDMDSENLSAQLDEAAIGLPEVQRRLKDMMKYLQKALKLGRQAHRAEMDELRCQLDTIQLKSNSYTEELQRMERNAKHQLSIIKQLRTAYDMLQSDSKSILSAAHAANRLEKASNSLPLSRPNSLTNFIPPSERARAGTSLSSGISPQSSIATANPADDSSSIQSASSMINADAVTIKWRPAQGLLPATGLGK